MTTEQPWTLKIQRACEHIQTLTELVAEYEASGAHEVVEEIDGDALVTRVAVHRRPPDRLSTVLGDLLHNARSALDALVFRFAEEAQGRPLSEAEERTLAFPVAQTPDAYEEALKPRGALALLDARHQQAVREVQPFRPFQQVDEERKKPMSAEEYESDTAVMPLVRLHRLSNIDKHRRLHVVSLALDICGWVTKAGEDPGQFTRSERPAPEGWEIGRLRRPGGPPPRTLGLEPSLVLAMEDGLPHDFDSARSVVDEARELANAAANAITIMLHLVGP